MTEVNVSRIIMCLHLEHPHAIRELLCDLRGDKYNKLLKGSLPTHCFGPGLQPLDVVAVKQSTEETFFFP